MFTYNWKLRRCRVADTSADHMAQSLATLVPYQVQIRYYIALLAIVHMYQEYQDRYSLYTMCLH